MYAKAGHFSIIGLRSASRISTFVIRGRMCMRGGRCPNKPVPSRGGKPEEEAFRRFIKRGCGDPEDNTLPSCAWTEEKWLKCISSSNHASIPRALYRPLQDKALLKPLTRRSGGFWWKRKELEVRLTTPIYAHIFLFLGEKWDLFDLSPFSRPPSRLLPFAKSSATLGLSLTPFITVTVNLCQGFESSQALYSSLSQNSQVPPPNVWSGLGAAPLRLRTSRKMLGAVSTSHPQCGSAVFPGSRTALVNFNHTSSYIIDFSGEPLCVFVCFSFSFCPLLFFFCTNY